VLKHLAPYLIQLDRLEPGPMTFCVKIFRLSVLPDTVSAAGAAKPPSDRLVRILLATPRKWGRPRPSKRPCPQKGQGPHLMYNPRPVNEALGKGTRAAFWGQY
jgi:hypothetical protein